jgi:hypothetical protein
LLVVALLMLVSSRQAVAISDSGSASLNVISPPVRMPDLVGRPVQFLERLPLRLSRHPLERVEVLFQWLLRPSVDNIAVIRGCRLLRARRRDRPCPAGRSALDARAAAEPSRDPQAGRSGRPRPGRVLRRAWPEAGAP